MISIMAAPIDTQLSKVNRRQVKIDEVIAGVTNDAGNKDVEVRIYLGDPSNLTGYNFQQDNTHSTVWYDKSSTAITEDPVISIMAAPIDTQLSKVNRRQVKIDEVIAGVTNDAGNKDVEVRIYLGDPSNLTGYNFQQDNTHSTVWYDKSSTAITGSPQLIRVIDIEPGESFTEHIDVPVARSTCLIITAKTNSGSSEVLIGVNGREDL